MANIETVRESQKLPNLRCIPEKEYERLMKRDFWLECLEQAGVDNWSGIDYAFDLKEEYNNE